MNDYFITGIGLGIVGLVIGLGGMHAIDANHYGAQIAAGKVDLTTEKLAHTADLKAVSDKAAADAFAALARQGNLEKQVADINTAHQQEIADEKAKNTKLAADVAAGTVRLRIAVAAANRPASIGGVPAATSAASGSDDATVELAPSARQAYFEVSGGIADDQAKIKGLQNYIKKVCLAPQ